MPLADIARVVAGPGEHVTEAGLVGIYSQFVDDHAGAGREFAGKKRGAIRRADGHLRDGLAEIDAFGGHTVDIGRPGFRIPGITTGLVAKLVGKEIDDVRPFRWFLLPRYGYTACDGSESNT